MDALGSVVYTYYFQLHFLSWGPTSFEQMLYVHLLRYFDLQC